MPLVSVVIPVYNTEQYLANCLESVLSQSHSQLEVICVDDGSTDASLQILKKYAQADSRVVVLQKTNGGVVSARKEGVKRATGEYICFLDSDDTIAPNMVQKLLDEMGDADLISCGVWREMDDVKTVRRNDLYEEGLYAGGEFQALLKNMIYDFDFCQVQRLTPWSVNKLYVAQKVAKIMETIEEGIGYAEDSVFLYRYLLDSKAIRIIHEPLYCYRYRENSAIHAVNSHILMDINKVYLALLPDFEKHTQKDFLCMQLQRWIAMMACMALNEHMGFDDAVVHIPEFMADLSQLRNKKVVLYGAGVCGQDLHRQLTSFGYEIVLWVDCDFERYINQGKCIEPVRKIRQTEYDVILIAVANEKIADDIKSSLVEGGVNREQIVWSAPLHIY